ncbi:aspartate/glutamate racemase family protein [Alloyangia pacifica]|uniref:aspartate/glutamate racemase family protein n=1 Tax=Alloyangia pacifica TaxID=311180 RepID=UPI001CFC4BF2|nr:aspartate/glutamate racemase family protein [Alloyangia pacifica]
MRILWVNPGGSPDYDAGIAAELAGAARAGTTGTVVSFAADAVPPHLEYDSFEAMAIPQIVRLAHQARAEGYDAYVIGCFYDTALEAAREVSGDMIVTAPCTAGLELAGALASRCTILSATAKAASHITRRIRGYGLDHRVTSVRPLGLLPTEFACDPGLTARRVEEEARAAIETEGAEAILLGCTLEYEAAAAIGDRLGVPLIDAVRAPFALAEHLAHVSQSFGWRPGRVGGAIAPAAQDLDHPAFAPAAIANRVEF